MLCGLTVDNQAQAAFTYAPILGRYAHSFLPALARLRPCVSGWWAWGPFADWSALRWAATRDLGARLVKLGVDLNVSLGCGFRLLYHCVSISSLIRNLLTLSSAFLECIQTFHDISAQSGIPDYQVNE